MKEGTFNSPYGDYKKYNGKHFTVIRELTEEDGFDTECLPVYLIKFDNGILIQAFPEELTEER